MTFISYSQNFEDVMLWRALKHVENGFYIDVGANDPTLYSVTRAFYERGWRGINVEPVLHYHDRLCSERPEDVNLNLAVGACAGILTLYDIPDTGLATTDKQVAERHARDGWEVEPYQVAVETLAEVCARYAGEKTLHFLKIDVEGAERNVLSGMNFAAFRPWILVIEATEPMSQNSNHATWESLVTDANYQFAYFDGLNRFYVAREKAELVAAFAVPPNVFDSFCLSSEEQSSLRIGEAENRARRAQLEVQRLVKDHDSTKAHFHEIEQRARQIEAQFQYAEAKAEQAEAKAEQAEAKAEKAEAKAEKAEAKAEKAEAKVQQLRIRAQQAEARAQEADQRAQQAEARAQQADQRAHEAEEGAEREKFDSKINPVFAEVEHRAQKAEAAMHQAYAEAELGKQHVSALTTKIDAIYRSNSWRITRPLRSLSSFVSGRKSLDFNPRHAVKDLIRAMAKYKVVRQIGVPLLAKFPALHAKMLRIAISQPENGNFITDHRSDQEPGYLGTIDSTRPLTPEEAALPSSAKAILDRLRAATRQEK